MNHLSYGYLKRKRQRAKTKKTIQIVLLTIVVLGVAIFAFCAKTVEGVKSPTIVPEVKNVQLTNKSVNNAVNANSSLPKKSTDSVETQIRAIAKEMGYQSPNFLVRLAKCESSLNPQAVGDKGTSFGLFQIHYPAQSGLKKVFHKDITKNEALQIDSATRWAIKKLQNGGAGIWTCTSILQ